MNSEDWTAYRSNEDMIISPRRGRNEKTIPSSGVLLVNPGDARFGHAECIGAGGESRSFFHSNLSIQADNRLFVAGPAVGAPIAAMTIEKLIALGAKNIYLLSWCGAISPEFKVGDIVIGGLPLSGEGTSRYYTCDLPAAPSPILTEKLAYNIQALGINTEKGKIWSTDAPYRENRGYLEKIRKDEGIVGVDMEYSALCAVCTFRKAHFAGVFLVSDELWGEKWRPGFRDPQFLARGRKLIAMLLSEHMHLED